MSNAAEQAFLDLLFLNTDWTGVGDAGGLRGSVAAGSFYVALHTADPGETGSAQTTSECTLGGYARQALARSGSGFSRSGSTITNVPQVTFPEVTSGSETITHYSVGVASSGTGQILYRAALTTPRLFTTGFTPIFPAAALGGTMD
jgi:hypothetical protein